MIHRIVKHTAKSLGKFYAANPHKAVAHGAAAVQIGTIAWTQGHHIAKHTAKFMAKAAVKGFNLFRS
jgi:dihydroorotate dehydrogenase